MNRERIKRLEARIDKSIFRQNPLADELRLLRDRTLSTEERAKITERADGPHPPLTYATALSNAIAAELRGMRHDNAANL